MLRRHVYGLSLKSSAEYELTHLANEMAVPMCSERQKYLSRKARPSRVAIASVMSSITSLNASAQSVQQEHSINSVREIRAGLRACWISPPTKTPARVTVRLSLKRNGDILGQPLISYTNPDASDDERVALHAAVGAALAHCMPLPISEALGDIIAGRPINVKLGEGWKWRGATVRPDR
jgi:hypothetical protein